MQLDGVREVSLDFDAPQRRMSGRNMGVTSAVLLTVQVVIETESDNSSSLALYERLGFTRDKRLHRFYSNGKDA
jgi:peptide alpha-N-acetyltransferase